MRVHLLENLENFLENVFYYNINYRKYEKGIHVESFSKSDLIKNREFNKICSEAFADAVVY